MKTTSQMIPVIKHLWQIQSRPVLLHYATSVLQAGDVGFQGWLSIPFSVSGTRAQLFTEVLLNHTHVFRV